MKLRPVQRPKPAEAPTVPARTAAGRVQARPLVSPEAPRTLEVPSPAAFEALLELPPVAETKPRAEAFSEPKGVLQGWWAVAKDTVVGSNAHRELGHAKKVTEAVSELAAELEGMSDDQLKAQTQAFKDTLNERTETERRALAKAEQALAEVEGPGRSKAAEAVDFARMKLLRAEQKVLDALLPEAFATVREASRRATGMFHFDRQVTAAALMHRGLIAEMYTGEGKTLAATLTVYLNALAGHGFHVATVNDYLARRDAEEMSAIYGYLGLSVGVLEANLRQYVIPPGGPIGEATRKEAYQADITYGTASELGFDYLRDNQLRDPSEAVQRPLHGVLLDEIDSLLIDEARVPLILASQGAPPDLPPLMKYRNVAERIYSDVLQALNGGDIEGRLFDANDVEWEENWIALTDAGSAKVERLLGIANLYDDGQKENLAYLQDALRAWFLFQEGGTYAVVDGKISTVGLGGHLGVGRRFTGGLHQALEAKHRLEVMPENVSSASITMREYLGLYAKRCGMTGTAMSARDAFLQVYELDVARVPTRKELIRVDYPDKRFLTEAEKQEQFLKDVEAVHATGRPILIGVEFTHTAEALGEELKKRGLKVNVLGAKSDADEAKIIAHAGRLGAITVATTRGGRGVDIKLGGDPRLIAEELMAERGLPAKGARRVAKNLATWDRADVLARGGLLVMGYEHLDSRRRDDQLRGRAGRQGEPGATVFYTSGEDRLFDPLRADAESPAKPFAYSLEEAPELTERALDRSEARVDSSLIQSLPYDKVVSEYRERFYEARGDVLAASDVREMAHRMIGQAVDSAFERVMKGAKVVESEEVAEQLYAELSELLTLPKGAPPEHWAQAKVVEIRADVDKLVAALLEKREEAVGKELAAILEKDAVLVAADLGWINFQEAVLDLRESIHFRAYAQKDPKTEFKAEVGRLYGELVDATAREVTRRALLPLPKLDAPPAGR